MGIGIGIGIEIRIELCETSGQLSGRLCYNLNKIAAPWAKTKEKAGGFGLTISLLSSLFSVLGIGFLLGRSASTVCAQETKAPLQS